MKDIARSAALKLLTEYEEQQTFLNLALKNGLRSIEDERDRRFATALVYGVVERKITLDHFISRCVENKIDPTIRSVLRMGIYQLFYMQVPASAACNTSVELVKQFGRAHSAGFVNAVLRRCTREKDQMLQLKKVDYSVRYSISVKLVDLLLMQYGKETFVEMMESGCGKDECMYFFCNPLKKLEVPFSERMRAEGVVVEKTEIAGLYSCRSSVSIEDLLSYRAGLFHVVGYHSAMAAALVPSDASVALDLCAAPGGKTFMISALIRGQVKAFDLHQHKVELLKKSALRLGSNNVIADVMNSEVFEPSLENTADFVLCDVPCSGLGMMGKKPDIKYKEYESDKLIETQWNILCNGSKYLKNGGRLVYSTCTIDRRENEQQIRRFLKENPLFTIDKNNFISGERLFLPGVEGDGFYIAVLKKGNSVES